MGEGEEAIAWSRGADEPIPLKDFYRALCWGVWFQIRGKTALVLSGSEDQVALAINLYNMDV